MCYAICMNVCVYDDQRSEDETIRLAIIILDIVTCYRFCLFHPIWWHSIYGFVFHCSQCISDWNTNDTLMPTYNIFVRSIYVARFSHVERFHFILMHALIPFKQTKKRFIVQHCYCCRRCFFLQLSLSEVD